MRQWVQRVWQELNRLDLIECPESDSVTAQSLTWLLDGVSRLVNDLHWGQYNPSEPTAWRQIFFGLVLAARLCERDFEHDWDQIVEALELQPLPIPVSPPRAPTFAEVQTGHYHS